MGRKQRRRDRARGAVGDAGRAVAHASGSFAPGDERRGGAKRPEAVSIDALPGVVRETPFRVRLARAEGMHVEPRAYLATDAPVEPAALAQLCDAARVPGVVAALGMPDLHHGFGVPIGCVLATEGTVSPSAVGYDINCGMRLLATGVPAAQVPLEPLAEAVRRAVPLGEGQSNVRLSGEAFRAVLEGGMTAFRALTTEHPGLEALRRPDEEAADQERTEDGGALPCSSAPISKRAFGRGVGQLGTLGGGNHFIEFQEVVEVYDGARAAAFGLARGALTVMIHSGSRGFGHQVADEHMHRAYEEQPALAVHRELASYAVDSPAGREYLESMRAAANFAYVNREAMTIFVRGALRAVLGERPLPLLYDVTHNMVKAETHGGRALLVHRKGTTRAFGPQRMAGGPFAATGQPVIIPGSMGTASYVLAGRDDAGESLFTVNHGAGRVMSRAAARGVVKHGRVVREGRISDREFDAAMAGIVLIAGRRALVKEEAPQAYKDIDAVIAVVTGAALADRVARVRPLAVLKG